MDSETEKSLPRKIIHCDMDAFYASVEQNDHPKLKGKPVVVGGDPQKRGVVAASSYEARKYGIRSAMSCARASRLCPDAVFVRPNFERYREVSDQVRRIFLEITPLVEALSLDEAYLDVTKNYLGEPIAQKIAILIKKRIKETTGLTASAGVGPNKLIAKIGSDFRKPDGLTVVSPSRVSSFLEALSVEKLWGVGPITAKRLHRLGLYIISDIRKTSIGVLEAEFGKYGIFLHGLSLGIDNRPVDPDGAPKSRGTETTFEHDTNDRTALCKVLESQANEIEAALEHLQSFARTITLKVKYSDFASITRSKTLFNPLQKASLIFRTARHLLIDCTPVGVRPIRLLGISASGLVRYDEPLQLWLDLELNSE